MVRFLRGAPPTNWPTPGIEACGRACRISALAASSFAACHGARGERSAGELFQLAFLPEGLRVELRTVGGNRFPMDQPALYQVLDEFTLFQRIPAHRTVYGMDRRTHTSATMQSQRVYPRLCVRSRSFGCSFFNVSYQPSDVIYQDRATANPEVFSPGNDFRAGRVFVFLPALEIRQKFIIGHHGTRISRPDPAREFG